MNTEYQTDDEAVREIGFTAGPKEIAGIILRPVTALSLSWLQRNGVFSDSFGDMLQKTAAFTFLHSADKQAIRNVVNDRAAFLDAVDDWIDATVSHHTELEPYAVQMNESLEHYMAATTRAANPGGGNPTGKK